MSDDSNEKWRQATILVRGGLERSPHCETSEALFLNSGYVYGSAEEAEESFDGTRERFVYSRFRNPTVAMFENRLALLEGADQHRSAGLRQALVFDGRGARPQRRLLEDVGAQRTVTGRQCGEERPGRSGGCLPGGGHCGGNRQAGLPETGDLGHQVDLVGVVAPVRTGAVVGGGKAVPGLPRPECGRRHSGATGQFPDAQLWFPVHGLKITHVA